MWTVQIETENLRLKRARTDGQCSYVTLFLSFIFHFLNCILLVLTDTDKKKSLSVAAANVALARDVPFVTIVSASVCGERFSEKSTQIWKMKGICVICALWYSAFRVKTAELNQRPEMHVLKDNYEHRKTNFWCAPGRWSRGSADGAAKEMWDRIKRGWVTGEGRRGDALQRSNLLVKCCRSMRWTHFPAF